MQAQQAGARVPSCVGVIMDGNRRWARARNMPTVEGHRVGYGKLKEFVGWATDAGVGTVIVYAFSTENWNRSAEEVGYLMDLFRTVITTEAKELKEKNVRLSFIGDRARFSPDLQDLMRRAESDTSAGTAGSLVVALSYGGRTEIVAAARALAASGVAPADITEERFARELWTAGMPDPDLVIRTGGETRLSNFLPWQSVYSELFFTGTLWPDFSEEEFKRILAKYATRERRHGA